MSTQIQLLFDCGANNALAKFVTRAVTTYYSDIQVGCCNSLLSMAQRAVLSTFDGVIPVMCVSIIPDDPCTILSYNEFARYWPSMPIAPLPFYYLDAYHADDPKLENLLSMGYSAYKGKGAWRQDLVNQWKKRFDRKIDSDAFVGWLPLSQFLPDFESDAIYDVNQQLVDMWEEILADWPGYSYRGEAVFVKQLPETFEKVPGLWANDTVMLKKDSGGIRISKRCCSRQIANANGVTTQLGDTHCIGWTLPEDLA